jgi:hypothetical protein
MSLLPFCQWIQSTPSSTFLRESTWGFPIVSAIHVLAIAWFGGTVLIPALGHHLKSFQRTGLALLLLTGVLLFWLEPVKCYASGPFRLKMLLLLVLLGMTSRFRGRMATVSSWALWAAIIVAARLIAYF